MPLFDCSSVLVTFTSTGKCLHTSQVRCLLPLVDYTATTILQYTHTRRLATDLFLSHSQKAQNFEHANARRGADRFLTLPTGPRLRYHVWGDKKDDQGDLIDILLLHDLGEAGGGFADLGVALARRGYRVFAPGRFGPFPNPGTLVAHTRLTLFLYNRRFPRPRRQRPRPAVQHLHVSRGPKKLRSGAGFVPKTVHSVRVRFRGFNRLSVHGRVWATSGRLDRLRCGSVLFVKRPIQLSPHASRAVRRRAVVH
jgi:hypothetical protein